jgi:hypothetical protein
MPHGGVGSDSRAQERRGSGEIEVRRDARDKALVDDNAVGIPAVSNASQVLVRGVVGEDHVWAELLEAGLALRAGAVGVDHAADRGELAGLELADRGADLGDKANNLVAGDAGVNSRHDFVPLVTHSVKIGVADTAEEDFNLHVSFG